MTDKNFFSCRRTLGFTLIETLLSITLLSAVAIGLFSFFTHAMTYTADNERRTVAINVARGTMAYFEKNVLFSSLSNYMTENNLSFLKVEKNSCSHEALSSLLFPSGNQGETISSQQSCTAQLAPTINDVQYETTVYIIRCDQEGWDGFLTSSEFASLPERLKEEIRRERNNMISSEAGIYMAKLYAVVRWGERNGDITWVEGVVTDETIR
ncbi:type II secretion system protein [Geobacillus thermoleovorans]|uniref:Prepilin-type N-terminal cleavage/methylation domain protein n=3 Tax=Geobacillus TaxID=129337 RepID=Q5KWL8_GEOKA|nr:MULTISPECIES: prepilin-type N-terminal cleavage/methylation domain-containing protein [Geobacillus]AWO75240.1 type II secretion system protein [Geobacillus thermoleovorans]MEB3750303.1 hypothetical protein [Geobacillus icigianus]BAD76918.1 hypothetical protein GK2633 [Geobacillus kaustophilus HTA426]